jgi:hemolysin activation/secretion protein
VEPPVVIPTFAAGHIAIPQVPAGAAVPEQARKLGFKLLGFDIQGEFEELAAQRAAAAAPLVGKAVTVAQIFEFADTLQQIYVRAGYPLARVVILPQEFAGSARIKLRIIDGFVERMDLDAIAPLVRARVAAVLAPLERKTHLKQAELERRLLIAGETPGLTLNATFAAGKEVGGSVLLLTGRYRPVSASIYLDNDMPAVFGGYQVVTTSSLNGVLGFGEQLTVSAAGLPDSNLGGDFPTRRYLSAVGSVPIGIDGWTLGFSGTNGVTTPQVPAGEGSQGLLNQGAVKLGYQAIKLRDFELAFDGQFDATNEEIDSLAVSPQTPLSLDRVRALRGGADGVWRLRESGTTLQFGATVSQGLNAFGARTAADATPTLPLSRQGANAVFSKIDGHFEIDQTLANNVFASILAAGQTSFHHALLTSEQYDIDGPKLLSGFTAGSLAGDTAWATRGELGRAFAVPIPSGALTTTPYLFGAVGESILEDPTALEIGDVQAANLGAGLRINFAPAGDALPSAYGFVEFSRSFSNDSALRGDTVLLGLLLQY